MTEKLDPLEDLKTDLPIIQPRKIRWTPAELYDHEFPEQKWIVPDLITEGLNLLAGRPKIGKSWLSLQIATAVATGGKVFDREVQQGKVLYYALEDSGRRLKDRIAKLGIPRDAPINFIQELRPLHKGGFEDLAKEFLDGHYTYAVIDTLTRAMPGLDQNEGRFISPIMARLQSLSNEERVCLQMNDHHKKPNGFNPSTIDDPIGSTAKVAVCDGVAGIFKRQGVLGATLNVTGRDIEEVDLRIKWDVMTSCWQLIGESNEIEINESEAEILAALDESGKMHISAIARFIGKDSSNTGRRVRELVNKGVLDFEYIEGKKYYLKAVKP